MRGPNCGRHVWFGYEGGFAFGDQKLYQEHAHAATHVAVSVGDRTETGTETGTETEMMRQATFDTCTPRSSCCLGEYA